MYSFMFNNNYIMNPFVGHHHCCCHCNPFNNPLNMLMLTSMFSNYFTPSYNYVTWNSMPYYNNFSYNMPQPVFNNYVPCVNNNWRPLFTVPTIPTLPTITPRKPVTVSVQPAKPVIEHTDIVDTGKLDKNFLNRVKQIAQRLNCDYRDLLAVMNSESGLDKNAKNPLGAVGLIQFTNSAIAELKRVYGINVTKEQILNMSAMEQLDLVEKYLMVAKKYAFSENAKLSAGDLYAIVYLPGRANREVLCSKGEGNNFYEWNSALDSNGDKKITKSELVQRVDSHRVSDSIFA